MAGGGFRAAARLHVMRTEWLCLSLTWTRGWEERDPGGDQLADFAGLIGWASDEQLLSSESAMTLRQKAGEYPEAADAALARLRGFRSATHALLAAIGSGTEPPARALEMLNRWLGPAHEGLELVRARNGGFRTRWRDDAEDLDRVLWACVRSLTDLLLAPELDRVKFCDAHDCGWLFIDASRNRSRRWCDMADCGNRAKVRRYRARQRGS